jgi:hypothetical protein
MAAASSTNMAASGFYAPGTLRGRHHFTARASQQKPQLFHSSVADAPIFSLKVEMGRSANILRLLKGQCQKIFCFRFFLFIRQLPPFQDATVGFFLNLQHLKIC